MWLWMATISTLPARSASMTGLISSPRAQVSPTTVASAGVPTNAA
jgi:hypothetical protein